jgi:hypothetical protein
MKKLLQLLKKIMKEASFFILYIFLTFHFRVNHIIYEQKSCGKGHLIKKII